MIRERIARAIMSLCCVVALCALVGCPPHGPTPIGPPVVGDAAPAPSCSTACAHAETVCPGSGSPCGNACNRIGGAFPACVLAAPGCPALNMCDPLGTGQ